MTIKSKITGKTYNTDNVRKIPNMLQNYRYLNTGLAEEYLVDIICGYDNKLIFVWLACDEMNKLYDKWCNRDLI